MEEYIEKFIDDHYFTNFFDEIFKDDVDYQNAQRDMGEIEYISFSNPEDVIYEKQYDWCKEHYDEVLEYINKKEVK